MDFQIIGGIKLSGSISVNAAKNCAVALLCASLINKGTTVLRNVPKIEEVNRIIEVLRSIKVQVTWINGIDVESALKTRSVILLIGSLIHRFSAFQIPQSGGCKLGTRTIRPHLLALEKLGVKIKTLENSFEVKYNKLKSAKIVLYESGDTATENTILAASAIPKQTTIKFASSNYMVQDLCFFLQKLGVKIKGVSSTTLSVEFLKILSKRCYFYQSLLRQIQLY